MSLRTLFATEHSLLLLLAITTILKTGCSSAETPHISQSRELQICDSTCDTCLSGVCTLCADTYFLDSGVPECTNTCPLGTYG